jgi:hypothetical protein
VQTVVTVTIKRTLKGGYPAGVTLEVGQLGGVLDGTDYQNADAAPLEMGKTYLLLLQTFADRPAALVNPVQGQYLATGSSYVARSGNMIGLSDATLRAAGMQTN